MSNPVFEEYRYNSPSPITLPRLIGGTVLAVAIWQLFSAIVLLPLILDGQGMIELMGSRSGMLLTLLTFAGIWIGVWLAVRFVHADRIGNVCGANGRLSWHDFAKGFAAVCLTSILSEISIYAIRPEFALSAISFPVWLAGFLPMVLLCLVQTSGEELLFRGYLVRGLANRFRSPWIWAFLPGLTFVSIHATPDMTVKDAALVLLTIGSLTILLVWLVYATGNLGAAMGVHMGNNLFAFMLVGHQDGLTSFALFKGAPVGDGTMSTGQTAALVITGWVCVALTWWLLASRRSPLCLRE